MFGDVVLSGIIRTLKSSSLFNVDFSIDKRVEKCCFDVKEVDEEASASCEGEDETNGGSFSDGSKSIFVVNVGDLCISLSDKSSFKARIGGFWVLDLNANLVPMTSLWRGRGTMV